MKLDPVAVLTWTLLLLLCIGTMWVLISAARSLVS